MGEGSEYCLFFRRWVRVVGIVSSSVGGCGYFVSSLYISGTERDGN